MIIDFRVRPPTGTFLSLSIASKGSLSSPTRVGVEPAPSFIQNSMDLFIKEMDEANVTKAVIMGRQASAKHGNVPNDEIAEIVRNYPGRFIPFAGISTTDIKAALIEIERTVKTLGFKGVAVDPGWAETPLKADDRRLYPIYAKCDELGIPVSITASIYVGPDIGFSLPIAIQRIAQDFPSLSVLVVHGAWPWVNEMVGICFNNKNIWLVPDVYMNIHGMPGATHFIEAANYYLGDRLLFASSYPLRPIKDSIEEFLSLPIKDEVKEKALYTNAARLLGLL